MAEAKHMAENQKTTRKAPVIILSLLLVLLLTGGAYGYVRFQEDSRQMGQELAALQQQLEETHLQVKEAQAAVAELTEERDTLQGQLEQALQDLETAKADAAQAEQALQERLAEEAEARKSAASAYDDLYPDLYAAPADLESQAPKNTVYLTFDDGPSQRTGDILDILKERGIKATFFVTGQTSQEAADMMRRIVEEGHTIAVHTYTHQYKTIYASVRAYLDDFYKIYTLIHDVTGVYPQVFRFPGGTVNGYNKNIYKKIVAEMDRRGFVHYDWNALNGDAEGKDYTVEEMTKKALAAVGTSHVIVLMHDSQSKTKTVKCLPAVIDGYEQAGYSFAPLSPEIKSITFD